MKGRLIVIEGLDGSGKATQAQLLYDRLQKQDAKVKKVFISRLRFQFFVSSKDVFKRRIWQ